MARLRKEKRNRGIVEKRKKGWSYREIAQHYKVSVRAVWEIFQRDSGGGQKAAGMEKRGAVA